jgi:hypothetical protein
MTCAAILSLDDFRDTQQRVVIRQRLHDRVMLPICQAATNGVLWRLQYSRSNCRGGLSPRAEWR